MAYKWTDEEIKLLKAKINTNIKVADIAAQMNIPVKEVYEKSSQLRKAGELERVREFKPRTTPPEKSATGHRGSRWTTCFCRVRGGV